MFLFCSFFFFSEVCTFCFFKFSGLSCSEVGSSLSIISSSIAWNLCSRVLKTIGFRQNFFV